ncbi:hypothetical protein [Sphingobacterium anhuiense]|uniref:hypothetical protein n=1 Tax=Sphingobacterium anhuiense TaxID=493780 RepID=UPI003C2B7786
MQNLQQACEEHGHYNEDLRRHLVNAIIVIAARNIAIVKPENISQTADTRILQIHAYCNYWIIYRKIYGNPNF